MERKFSVTIFKSVIVTSSSFREEELEWSDLRSKYLDTHWEAPIKDKLKSWVIGPYRLKAVNGCKHNTRSKHRCDACVAAISMAVFDVDQGTYVDVLNLQENLQKENVAGFLHTTHSYDPAQAKRSYRLVIPLAEDIMPEDWKALRDFLITKFSIPADRKTSSGVSHSYFLPAVQPGVFPQTVCIEGEFLRPYDYVSKTPKRYKTKRNFKPLPPELEEDPPLPEVLDLAPYKEILNKKYKNLQRRDPKKADLLFNLAKGNSLAQHGERDLAMTRATGMVAWYLRGTPINVMFELFRPSLEKMQAEGSKLTEDMVIDKLRRAALYRLKADAEAEEFQSELKLIREEMFHGTVA